MRIKKTQRLAQIFFTTICGIMLIIGCDACDDGVTDPPVTRPAYTLNISLHNNVAPEMFVGESVQFAGELTDRDGNKLSGEKVIFYVQPDSVGSISPNLGAFTNPADPAGFREQVTFVARKEGIALITARFKIEGLDRAVDTLHVQSKLHGNE
ncbi:MAG: hypothetical protein HN356_00925 [Calditrichaeota bacterium]|jgi:hypothetical protein|nr:hypothetical protein [Calditrichota bacterium]MBT7618466.1 hypothetical protein [Calditrichota bacterium]MBT7787859.1 hypothetical protein [Calditrichota bacterium]